MPSWLELALARESRHIHQAGHVHRYHMAQMGRRAAKPKPHIPLTPPAHATALEASMHMGNNSVDIQQGCESVGYYKHK